ncbi:DUF177 domain-containing protein [Lactobacillus sp. DCY120]|uniref:DUF177 domain-containing protein n=1 Tax=Bombilactobacillus apium TaxID=2675299 RepID=A0A850RC73_9LACO|nr:YceD family protein [Bombilactobacillus apium]NVY96906.1 DUF177 domain-containing protein [Bombilactobacillus apium]
MLNWQKLSLTNYQQKSLEIDQTFDVQEHLQIRDPEIIALTPVLVQGSLTWKKPFFWGDFHVQTQLTYPSTRSLTPVELKLDFMIHEAYTNVSEQQLTSEEREQAEVLLFVAHDELDFLKVLEDNLLLSIPTQVLTLQEQNSEVMPAGKQWTVMSEEQYQQQQENKVNPELAKLKSLFPQEDQD